MRALCLALLVAGPAAAADLPAFPAFAAFLEAEAEGARADFPGAEIADETRFAGRGHASVLRLIRAGGHVFVEAQTWDAAGPVRLDRFFDEGRARDEALIVIATHLRAELARRFGRDPGGREAATAPDAAVLSNFTVLPGAAGLAFHFGPGEVAPEAAGPVEVAAPRALFVAWLNPAAAALFR